MYITRKDVSEKRCHKVRIARYKLAIERKSLISHNCEFISHNSDFITHFVTLYFAILTL